jgi:outer membrane protein OmpA-like peptidoglycan-associated protein
VIGKLTPGGSVPTSLSSDVMGFITGGASAATVAASKVVGTASHAASGAAHAAVDTAAAAGGGLMKWLPWLAAGIAALFMLSYCNKGTDASKQAADNAKATAVAPAAPAAPAAPVEAKVAAVTMPAADAAKATGDAAAAKATADAAAKAVAEAIPAGAGLVGYMANGMPALKVYFDTGKTEVAKEFGDKSKDNAGAKAIISGYNDPTGNAAANAELSKNRAKGVAAALKAAGAADDRVVLEKPADTTTGAALSNAEARRVEVTIRK